jgi:hypothetical protein
MNTNPEAITVVTEWAVDSLIGCFPIRCNIPVPGATSTKNQFCPSNTLWQAGTSSRDLPGSLIGGAWERLIPLLFRGST